MEQAIQFESVVESGTIRIPEQYSKNVPTVVMVTLAPVKSPMIKMATKSKANTISLGDFSALQINTGGWKFDREEANERR